MVDRNTAIALAIVAVIAAAAFTYDTVTKSQVRLQVGQSTFGHENIGSSARDITGEITGSVFTMTEDGTADSISFYMYARSINYKCAIYKHEDGSLVGSTEEGTQGTGPVGILDWYTLNFSDPKPSLTSGTEYVLGVWTNESNPGWSRDLLYYDSGDTNQGHYDSETYGAWPNPASFSHNGGIIWPPKGPVKYSIYVTYTPTVTIPEGTLVVVAFANSTELNIPVEVIGIDTYTTPFSTMVPPGPYTLSGVYNGQVQTKVVTVVAGEETEVRLQFVYVPPLETPEAPLQTWQFGAAVLIVLVTVAFLRWTYRLHFSGGKVQKR